MVLTILSVFIFLRAQWKGFLYNCKTGFFCPQTKCNGQICKFSSLCSLKQESKHGVFFFFSIMHEAAGVQKLSMTNLSYSFLCVYLKFSSEASVKHSPLFCSFYFPSVCSLASSFHSHEPVTKYTLSAVLLVLKHLTSNL